mmetsp:Transcript_68210/g.197583  ORF Transcript_68210/g.197583 Transcript_68210/m.197583 type:complete len:181 (-) Transcript_68210:104-646(-)
MGFQADIWSAGVVLTEMFAGGLPPAWRLRATPVGWKLWPSENHRQLQRHITTKVAHPHVRELLLSLTAPRPVDRCSAWIATWTAYQLAMNQSVKCKTGCICRLLLEHTAISELGDFVEYNSNGGLLPLRPPVEFKQTAEIASTSCMLGGDWGRARARSRRGERSPLVFHRRRLVGRTFVR